MSNPATALPADYEPSSIKPSSNPHPGEGGTATALDVTPTPIIGDDDLPPRVGRRVGSTALEKLCIAIINAHPLPPGLKNRPTPGMRLSAALYALQGVDYRDKEDGEPFIDLQLRMAENLYTISMNDTGPVGDRVEVFSRHAKRPGYVHQLATDALTEAGERISRRAITFLSRRFIARWPYLLNEIKLSDTRLHTLEGRALEEIGRKLAEVDVPNTLPQTQKMFWRLYRDDL